MALIASPARDPERNGSIQEEMRWQGWVPSGQIVEINNVRGNVRAEAAEGDEIEAVALKRGSGDPEQVAIQVVEHKGGVTICAVYPNAIPAIRLIAVPVTAAVFGLRPILVRRLISAGRMGGAETSS